MGDGEWVKANLGEVKASTEHPQAGKGYPFGEAGWELALGPAPLRWPPE